MGLQVRLRWLDELAQDVRYALRTLRKAPAFTATAVLTLALGIGANSAIFSIVDGVLIRPLPYEDPDRVVRLVPLRVQHGETDGTFSYLDLQDLRARTDIFEGVAMYDPTEVVLHGEDGAVRVEGAFVNADYFRVLGVRPALGRFFLPEEDEPGSARSAVISHALWQSRFGGDPGVIGRPLSPGSSYTIVGIAPADFEDPGLNRGSRNVPQVWASTPAYWTRDQWAERGMRFLTAAARLREGVTLESAQAAASTLMRRLAAEYPDSHAGWDIRLVRLKDRIVGPVRPALLALSVAVGLVLLIACANLANLLLARAAGRRRELAVRAALGGSRGRIARQLLTESVVLALLGGVLGVFLAWLARDVIVALGAGQLPRLAGVDVDARVVAFTAGLSVLTGVLFGIAPSLRAARLDLNDALKAEGHGTASRRRVRFRAALVAVEVALTVVLLAGAGLLVRSLASLYAVNPGLEADGVLTFRLSPPYNGYETDDRVHAFYDRLLERLAALPGVESAGATNILPFSGGYWRFSFLPEGRPAPERREDTPGAEIRTATPALFATLRTPVLRGRGIEERDRAGATPVVVINQALADAYFPGEDPIGRRIQLQDGVREIVGVVADVRQFELAKPAEPVLYIPFAQAPFWLTSNAYVVLRTAGDPMALAADARAVVRELDPRIPVSELRAMDDVIGATVATPRFRTTLLSLFAALAFTLAAIGIYGVVAYGVAERRREIGIRMALGARAGEVLGMVVRQGLRPVLVGTALGLPGALAAGRLLRSMLFGIGPTDPVTFLGVPLLVGLVAVLASALPARRAARMDPVSALRAE